MSGKVQNASTHPLGRKSHEHVHSSRSVQGSVQGGKHTPAAELSWILQPSKLATPLPTSTPPPCKPRERGRAPTIGANSYSILRTREAALRQFSGANSYSILRTRETALRQFSGAMDEMSQKVQNASTHPLGRKHHEHAHSSWSVQGSVQGGDGWNV